MVLGIVTVLAICASGSIGMETEHIRAGRNSAGHSGFTMRWVRGTRHKPGCQGQQNQRTYDTFDCMDHVNAGIDARDA